ncbi:L-threonylcarbamoyladenylate synthase [Bacterioplanoides sp.]|uniref:L-threonylcarbamoyladenylate synthase n=1 Tax=Bacterioplanoides sp. TaxID=2066072 RepID=UPI003B58E197
MNPWHLEQARRCVEQGGVIAYPTEAVWGLGCDPTNDEAIQRILDIKKRPWQKGMLVVAASLDQLDDYLLPLSGDDFKLVDATWPGPVTWVLPCDESVSPLLRGETRNDQPTLAVRISAHPMVRALCEKAGPLVSTSANPAGREPARSMVQLRQYFKPATIKTFGGKQVVDFILPGNLGGQKQPSEIRTLDGQRLR